MKDTIKEVIHFIVLCAFSFSLGFILAMPPMLYFFDHGYDVAYRITMQNGDVVWGNVQITGNHKKSFWELSNMLEEKYDYDTVIIISVNKFK